MPQAPKLFTCPRCRQTYLGHDPLPDCPHCGYDYPAREGFRWDLVVYLLAIFGLLSFLLVASYYRKDMGVDRATPQASSTPRDSPGEKLPGSGTPGAAPFQSPYHEPGR
jgi:hypothetical protein